MKLLVLIISLEWNNGAHTDYRACYSPTYRTPPTQPPRQEFASRRSWWVLVAINGAILLAIFAYLWVWRRRRAKSQSSS